MRLGHVAAAVGANRNQALLGVAARAIDEPAVESHRVRGRFAGAVTRPEKIAARGIIAIDSMRAVHGQLVAAGDVPDRRVGVAPQFVVGPVDLPDDHAGTPMHRGHEAPGHAVGKDDHQGLVDQW